ncbi:MAG: peptide chain release factor 2 [Candidatus Yanofskybacteria bacterium]|nr:peptide chain release factor 2 [Candidatus Yanofskybacteria bacterium]
MQASDFWKDYESAQKMTGELSYLKSEVEEVEKLEKDFENPELWQEAEKRLKSLKLKTLFSGKYDKSNALLEVFSGAGGIDAQDWAAMLFKMYQRYAEKNNFNFRILHQSFGEQKGLKSATAEIKGKFAYGYLKGESGVHRLVRISPFSAKNLRHTSFALVDFLPLIEDVSFQVRTEDLKIDTFKSSGPGGQNVNKLETAVRVTHLPTGLAVAVQSERSQSQNKEKALQVLYARLAQLMEKQKIEELSKLKSQKEPGGVEWGSQIRSYVLHPYKLVKDHRTGVESSQPEKVLDGELEEFIEAEVSLL